MTSLFARRLSWLYDALRFSEGSIPVHIRTDAVEPVIDVAQGGWAYHNWVLQSFTHPASTAAQTNDVNPGAGAGLLAYVGIVHSGGAAPGVVSLNVFDPVTGNEVVISSLSIAVGATAGHVQLSAANAPWIIPPDKRLRVRTPATGVGEQWFIGVVSTPFQKGFKPL